MVLVVAEDGVQAVTGFQDASMLQAFGLPRPSPKAWATAVTRSWDGNGPMLRGCPASVVTLTGRRRPRRPKMGMSAHGPAP
jgi:hypothetical protein